MRLSRAGAGAGLAALLVAVICVRLGFWQLDRLAQRRAFNAAVQEAMARPPVALDRTGYEAIRADPRPYLYRLATAEGVFDEAGAILLRGRSHEGSPGVHLVSPLLLDGGGVILVNRGWLPSPDGATADPLSVEHAGRRRVTGLLQAMPHDPAAASPLTIRVDGREVPTFRRLDYAAVSTLSQRDLPQLYLEELPPDVATSRLPIPVAAPALDEGPHLGYAVQWFSFAAIAVVGFVVFLKVSDGRKSPAPL